MPARALQHQDSDRKDPETLSKEARSHIANEPALQLMAELLTKLRALDLPWWTPERLRARWGATERMRWYKDRWDLRQSITTKLTGLAPKAARTKTPDFQATLIDSVLEEGDISVRTFEEVYEPLELVIYGPPAAFWHFFRESMPWEQDIPVHQELLAWLLKALLNDRSSFAGLGRIPILTPWEVRTAISGKVWHTRIPLDVRVAIDEARFKLEKEKLNVPFHAESDLGIAVPEIIAGNVPLRELIPVLLVAERSMGFEPPKVEVKAPEVAAKPAEAAAPEEDEADFGTTQPVASTSSPSAASSADAGWGSGPAPAASAPASAAAPGASAVTPGPVSVRAKPGSPVPAPPGGAVKPGGPAAPVRSPVKPPPASDDLDIDNLDLSALDVNKEEEVESERTNPRLVMKS